MSFALSINTESPRLQLALSSASADVKTSMERLASGKKINSASDDAAGFAIAERMTSQVKGLNKVVQNLSDAISLVETAQATTSEVTDIVQRLRELTVQGLSDLNSVSDKHKIQTEIAALILEIGSIGEESLFNENAYHRTTMYSIQTGINDDDQLHFHLNYINPNTMGNASGLISSFTSASNATLKAGNQGWSDGDHKFLPNDVIVLSNIDAPNSKTGTTTYAVTTVLNNADGSQTLTLATDFSDNDKNNILSGNFPVAVTVAGLEFPAGGGFNIIGNGGHKSLANIDITDSSKASSALRTIDGALKGLNQSSAYLGTLENRLHFSVSNALSISESTESARSSILDADYALESARLAKGIVLQQSAVAMLAQSRAQPQLVLSLLKSA